MPDSNSSARPNLEEPNSIAANETPSKKDAANAWQTEYESLIRERDRLIDTVRSVQSDTGGSAPDALQEGAAAAGTEANQLDQNLSIISTDQSTLAEIEAALVRIADGTYGICEVSGEPIPCERLKAIPWTRYTVAVQQQIEQDKQQNADAPAS